MVLFLDGTRQVLLHLHTTTVTTSTAPTTTSLPEYTSLSSPLSTRPKASTQVTEIKNGFGSGWCLHLPRRYRRNPARLLPTLPGPRHLALLAPWLATVRRLDHHGHLLDSTNTRSVLPACLDHTSLDCDLWRRTHLSGDWVGSAGAVEPWLVL